MNALDNLTKAISDLQAQVNAITPPADNSAAIQAAADSVNGVIATLNSKFPPAA